MPKIDQARILIMATDGFERSELAVPRDKLRAAGAKVEVASPEDLDTFVGKIVAEVEEGRHRRAA